MPENLFNYVVSYELKICVLSELVMSVIYIIVCNVSLDIHLRLDQTWEAIEKILGVTIDFYHKEYDRARSILKIKILDVQKITTTISQGCSSDELFKMLYLLPAHNSLRKNVYVSVEGYLHQYIPALLSADSRLMEEYVMNDPLLLKKIKNIVPEKNPEFQEEQIIQVSILPLSAQKKAQQFLDQVYRNRKMWKFSVSNVSGQEKFLQLNCRLIENQTVQNIEKLKPDIEALFRCQVIIKEHADRGIFTLVALLNEELSSYEMSIDALNTYNAVGEFFIGESLMGSLSAKWNFQTNFFWVAGMSGAGKSVQIKNILAQLAQISQYDLRFDYTTMFLTSSSKIADFIEFEKAGAFIASGINSQLKVFEYVLKELERRERLFYAHQVENIKEYNEKYPEAPLEQLVLLADEYENTRNGLDKKQSDYAERLLLNILNIGRSSGCVVIIGIQSALEGAVGIVADKLTVKFSGYNESNVLRKLSPAIASYYQTLKKGPQGVFFYNSLNLRSEQEVLTYDMSYVLIQTPYVLEINQENLPKLLGREMEEEIFKSISLEDDL